MVRYMRLSCCLCRVLGELKTAGITSSSQHALHYSRHRQLGCRLFDHHGVLVFPLWHLKTSLLVMTCARLIHCVQCEGHKEKQPCKKPRGSNQSSTQQGISAIQDAPLVWAFALPFKFRALKKVAQRCRIPHHVWLAHEPRPSCSPAPYSISES